MPSKKSKRYESIADEVARIDAQRDDPSADQARYVAVEIVAPVTEFNMRYGQTVAVDFEEGRFPAWFAPFRPHFRRLDMDPQFGFFVQRYKEDGSPAFGRYCALNLTALVLREPRYDPSMVERLAAAAKAAGWSVEGKRSGTPGFSAQEE